MIDITWVVLIINDDLRVCCKGDTSVQIINIRIYTFSATYRQTHVVSYTVYITIHVAVYAYS